jgi:cation transport ATPase
MRLPEPRTMLLIDGLGGVATAIQLCLVLPSFHSAIGLPPRALVMLGLFGVVYGCYSLGCWKLVRNRWRRVLTIIIAANVIYCMVSALVLVMHRNTMTPLGASYFFVEIAVILTLVAAEVAVLKRCPRPQR